MGCTESAPVASDFHYHHKVDPTVPALGEKHGAAPSNNNPVQVIVREKLFSWSGDTFKLKSRDGRPFGNNLYIQGKVWALRDQMVLKDGISNEPVVVCLRKFEIIGQTFKLYSTSPVYPGQQPSAQNYKNYQLYTYATVERVPFSTEQRVKLPRGGEFIVQRAGSWWPKSRVVKKNGRVAAHMEGGTWDGNWNSYLITVNPGIDPCLIVCVCAVCDEMDEDR